MQDLVDAADGRLKIIEADAMDVDIVALADAPRRVIKTLPYNVGNADVIALAETGRRFRELHLDVSEGSRRENCCLTFYIAIRTPQYRHTLAGGRLSVIRYPAPRLHACTENHLSGDQAATTSEAFG